MHLRNKLTVKKVASLTAPNVYSDGGGLYVRVRKSGTKSWLFVCMQNGKRREIGLGSVLDVSLAQARHAAQELRAVQLEGNDPAEVRRQEKAQRAQAVTFGEVASDLMDSLEEGFRNEKHRKQWRSSIETHAARLLPMRVEAVDTNDILAVLQPIWLEKPETASRVRQRIERILSAATVQGLRSGDNPARLAGHLDLLLPRQRSGERRHHPALAFQSLPAFIEQLRERPAPAARALEFTILSAARTGEVLGATWQEIDFERRVWTVPAVRMKMGRLHEVPLSDPALAVLQKVKPPELRLDRPIFLGPRGGTLSNMAMATLLKRMDVRDATVHGFRSSFRDWAGEQTDHAREEIEMALAHEIRNATERAYRRGNALEKRRVLMADWASFCDLRKA